jgi:hypothetical protein
MAAARMERGPHDALSAQLIATDTLRERAGSPVRHQASKRDCARQELADGLGEVVEHERGPRREGWTAPSSMAAHSPGSKTDSAARRASAISLGPMSALMTQTTSWIGFVPRNRVAECYRRAVEEPRVGPYQPLPFQDAPTEKRPAEVRTARVVRLAAGAS